MSLRKKVIMDVNADPYTGCSFEEGNIIYIPESGPYIPRPRDKKGRINYLEKLV
ncbi:SH3 domain-containing protein [Anaerocolumna chitinilytica]|uniref:Uncharacterized protein n=1 Tax=Anaerocolumna chitinilytica TaxID=1727145 RepID=A0A7M3S9E0_9FIRM|nr:hypothetical protein [Anaerocolumna chitinilytica]BCK01208.1 hypothetical protein bsdcttw_42480 [Anaerocolumna chitinilytica]